MLKARKSLAISGLAFEEFLIGGSCRFRFPQNLLQSFLLTLSFARAAGDRVIQVVAI